MESTNSVPRATSPRSAEANANHMSMYDGEGYIDEAISQLVHSSQVGAFGDVAHAAHVVLGERVAVVGQRQAGIVRCEVDPPEALPAFATALERVLGVLEQLVDEMGFVIVEAGSRVAGLFRPLLAVVLAVPPANFLVIRCNRLSFKIRSSFCCPSR